MTYRHLDMKLNVPTLKAQHNTCGPTALRMVLAYNGVQTTEKEILKHIGGLRRYGVRTTKLVEEVKRHGFAYRCYSYEKKMSRGMAIIKKPDDRDIIRFLRKKIPVILAVNAHILFGYEKSQTMGHFIVITGYDKGRFFYNDSWDGKSHSIDAEDLKFAWYNNVIGSSAYFLALWHKKASVKKWASKS